MPALFPLFWHILVRIVSLVSPEPWWRHQMETFSALLALCAGNSPVPVNSPHKGQWRGAFMFSLICTWINDWVNNRETGDLKRYRGHCDVNVMAVQREREIEEGEERDMSPIHVIPTFMFQNNERCHNLQVHRVDVQAPWGVLQLAHQTLLELELYGHRTTQGPRRYGREIMCWIVLKIHENTFAKYSDLTRTSRCDKSPKTSLLKPTTKKTSKIRITSPSTSWGELTVTKGQ